jgi:type I restriction enzyme M protein
MPNPRVAESRTERLIEDLLTVQGWSLRRPPHGDLLVKQEYKDYAPLQEALKKWSKTTKHKEGGVPEYILVGRENLLPLAVIEAKAKEDDIDKAITDATWYGTGCVDAGFSPLAIGVAGTQDDSFKIQVHKWVSTKWRAVTYEGNPISWIPNREQMHTAHTTRGLPELRPAVPPPEVLKIRADEINRLLRESGLKDDFRPAAVGAIMLALWQSSGEIRRSETNILVDINHACEEAFQKAGKPELAKSLRVDEANNPLARRARRICEILERLNITSLTAEHDYLGTLYEEFFRYTGGNTIGQYFTPRHITGLMADIVEVGKNDITLDPACGTGGFLIAAMERIQKQTRLSRKDSIKLVQKRLIGMEKEPVTAALCVANMILRGDGTSGVIKADCLEDKEFPFGHAQIVLMNPPFPHKKTDTPPEKFVNRALAGLGQRGKAAIIVPASMLVKKPKWRKSILKEHTLDAVVSLPGELFQPYAASTTAILVLEQGMPHPKNKKTFFCRIQNDGFRLKKGVRVKQPGSQVKEVLNEYQQGGSVPGFCAFTALDLKAEWAPGAYIPAKPISESDLRERIAELVRIKTAFTVRFAPELTALTQAVASTELTPKPYTALAGKRKPLDSGTGGTIRDHFAIFYGQKQLHSKEALGPGKSLIVSSSGADNGCYGFFDFGAVIRPPFVTVPSTGSIGKAHVQEYPCGVTDDCLILLPRPGMPDEALYAVAAVLRHEEWRFNYGRKMTPKRIGDFPFLFNDGIKNWIAGQLNKASQVTQKALSVLAGVGEVE